MGCVIVRLRARLRDPVMSSWNPPSPLRLLLITVCISISDDDNLDGGEVLREIVKIEQEFMGNNFVPAVLMIGGMGLALHYEELAMKYDGAPLIMAYGLPVSGKSLAVSIAMAIIGEHTSIGG